MRNLRSFIGMPAILEGKRLGRVIDVGLCEELRAMTGVYINRGLKGVWFIPEGQVNLLGEVAVLLSGAGQRAGGTRSRLLRRAFSLDGQPLGAICGALLDEETRRVRALELSGGYLDDLLYGRQWVRHYSVNRESGEVLVRPSVQDDATDEGRDID